MVKSSMLLKLGIPLGVLLLIAAIVGGVFFFKKSPPEVVPVASVEEQIAAAQSHLNQKRYEKVIEIAQQILATHPDNTQARALLESAQRESKQLQLEALLIEAQNLKAQNQLPESRKVLEKLLEIDPANESALKVIAEIDAALSASKSVEEQDAMITQWLKNAVSLLDAGKLAEAKAELDKTKKLRPNHPQLAQLYKQWDAKNMDVLRRQRELSDAAQKQGKVAELSHAIDELFKQGQYDEAQRTIDQLLALAPQNSHAVGVRNQISETLRQIRLYDAALSAKSYDEAMNALARLERSNPTDPSLAERRKRVETLKASAKAQFSVYRLGEAATVLLDDQRIDTDGEVQNKVVPIGKHTLAVRNSRGLSFRMATEFSDGQNLQYVYDAEKEKPELREMKPADREIVENRKTREQARSFPVDHNHTFGKCSGDLRISPTSVEYKAAKGDHSFTFPIRDMKLVLNNERLEFTDKKGKKERFTPANPSAAKEILQLWSKLEKISK